jgi:glyoxylase-like metal-dependent hydrolase (beta-lactamase superfamily II)
MEIKIHNIGSYIVKNYLLETPVGWIALDTGYRGGVDRFLKRFSKLALVESLKYVFLTHAHDDHAGFLAALLKKTHATLIVNTASIPLLASGENATPPGAGFSTRFASLFDIIKKDHSFPPFHVSGRSIRIPDESAQVFKAMGLPIRIVFLPGHTRDSMGLLLEETGQLLCGDAAMNTLLISTARHTIWIDDPVIYGQSWDKMLSLNPSKLYPSHGSPFSPKDLVKYRHFMDGKKPIVPKRAT